MFISVRGVYYEILLQGDSGIVDAEILSFCFDIAPSLG